MFLCYSFLCVTIYRSVTGVCENKIKVNKCTEIQINKPRNKQKYNEMKRTAAHKRAQAESSVRAYTSSDVRALARVGFVFFFSFARAPPQPQLYQALELTQAGATAGWATASPIVPVGRSAIRLLRRRAALVRCLGRGHNYIGHI